MNIIENMKNELENYGLEDNPFDYLLCKSLELSRALAFASHRYRSPGAVGNPIPETISNLMNDIENCIVKLASMDTATVALCGGTSATCEGNLFNNINNVLLGFEDLLPTKMIYTHPARNDDFECIRLGEDSPEYQRLLELRKIYEENKDEFKKYPYLLYYTRALLYHINNPDSVGYDKTEDVKKCEEFIKKYNLTEDDVDYIISYYELRDKEKIKDNKDEAYNQIVPRGGIIYDKKEI